MEQWHRQSYTLPCTGHSWEDEAIHKHTNKQIDKQTNNRQTNRKAAMVDGWILATGTGTHFTSRATAGRMLKQKIGADSLKLYN